MQPPGRAFFYPAERIVVIDLNGVLPPELSVQVKDVVCENGEMRLVFGPSQYRLDKLLATWAGTRSPTSSPTRALRPSGSRPSARS